MKRPYAAVSLDQLILIKKVYAEIQLYRETIQRHRSRPAERVTAEMAPCFTALLAPVDAGPVALTLLVRGILARAQERRGCCCCCWRRRRRRRVYVLYKYKYHTRRAFFVRVCPTNQTDLVSSAHLPSCLSPSLLSSFPCHLLHGGFLLLERDPPSRLFSWWLSLPPSPPLQQLATYT